MDVFAGLQAHDYEQVVLCQDKTAGLKAIIAIHDTTLGPALGGTRMWTYGSDGDAIRDAMRLARGMTYKAAAAGLNLGGGKAVIMGDPKTEKNEILFRAFGRYVHSLGGRYITAEDVGTCVQDMDWIRMETPFVTGSSGGSGDPSPFTAYGTYMGIKAACGAVFENDRVHGKTVAVQGLGQVGYHLCRRLADKGARLVVTDINSEAVERVVQEFGAQAVPVNSIYDVPCDIFAPCALGAGINDETIDRIQAPIIAGAANNVLAEERHGDALAAKGVLYIPDYIINAGGLINVADELEGYDKERVLRRVRGIYDTVSQVIAIAKALSIPTYKAADLLAETRIEKLGRVRSTWMNK